METVSRRYDAIIEALIIFVLLLSSTTGWYLIDFVGMSYFWLVFVILTAIIVFCTLAKVGFNNYFKCFLSNKLNVIIIIYLIWITITYIVNYTGRFSILYVCKAWFIIGAYLIVSQAYFNSLNKEHKFKFIYQCAKGLFLLGTILSLVAIYQFVYNSNNMFGLVVSDWPAYNPASMYGNVNGFGTYLFFSIISGIYLLMRNAGNKYKYLITFTIVIQIYMLYLTVARTSIVITIFYIIVIFSLFSSFERKKIRALFNFRTILILVLANVVMLAILNLSDITSYITHTPKKTTERRASDMLAEKNSKGVNNRQFIWKDVLNEYKQYEMFGDGLKYNVVKRINVEEIISKRSKGVSRISYHNTLFRYFASNGLLGLCIFIVLYFYVPTRLVKNIKKDKRYSIEYLVMLTLFACLFLYMQMEEVYIGEVGLVPIATCLIMSFSNSLLE